MNDVIKDVGLGILCWKGYDSLIAMLESYKEKGFLELFEEKVVFFQEIDDEACKIANQYGLKAYGNDKNTGIYGGFCELTEHLKSQTLLFVENDQPLVVSKHEARKQLEFGRDYLQSGQAHLVQYRHRHPDNLVDFENSRLRLFYPLPSAPLKEKMRAAIRRILRPGKAKRFAGPACYLMENPQNRFKEIKYNEDSKFLFTKSKNREWITQNFMIEKKFFENVILKYIEELNPPEKHLVNGFKSIERSVRYKKWWHKQNFTVAMAAGIFVHDRKSHRGY